MTTTVSAVPEGGDTACRDVAEISKSRVGAAD